MSITTDTPTLESLQRQIRKLQQDLKQEKLEREKLSKQIQGFLRSRGVTDEDFFSIVKGTDPVKDSSESTRQSSFTFEEKIFQEVENRLTSKFSGLLQAEVVQRQKISNWIRDSLGPNLEHVKALIREQIERQPIATSGTFSDIAFGVDRSRDSKSLHDMESKGPIKKQSKQKNGNDEGGRGEHNEMEKKEASTSSLKLSALASSTNSSSAASKNRFDEKRNYSDEEWSDSSEEEKETQVQERRKKLQLRATENNPSIARKLIALEQSSVPNPLKRFVDLSGIPTTSRTNIEHSVPIHETIYQCPTDVFLQKLRAMNEKGAKVLFVPSSAPITYDANKPQPNKDPQQFLFGIRREDQLYPVCNDGLGNSQILYILFQGIKRSLGTERGIILPHGALYGYDIALETNAECKRFVSSAERQTQNECFQNAFGLSKVSRFGEKKGTSFHSVRDWKQNPSHQETMREFFTLFYYVQPQSKLSREDSLDEGRVLFFVFQQSVPIVIERLLEANVKNVNNIMEKIVVIAIPFDDETNIHGDAMELKKLKVTREQLICTRYLNAFKKYASIFVPMKYVSY